MTLVQRLGRNLPSVVDTHQSGRMRFLFGVEICIVDIHRWIPTGRAVCWSNQGPEGIVCAGE